MAGSEEPMTITRVGILGGDELGAAFARALARVEIRAVLSEDSWSAHSLSALLGDIQDSISVTPLKAAAEEDVVFLAVRWTELAETLAPIADWEGRILIDATGPEGPSCGSVDIGYKTSSEWVRDLCPGAQLVKAFNGMPAQALAAGPWQGRGTRVIFLAGDHARAKLEVRRLIMQMGFEAIDLGDLASGGKLLQFPDGSLWGKTLVRVEL